jgi:LacI family transcriptional regulator
MMKQRPRQIDVARLAGVSPATVSLVLNGRTGGNVRISLQTRERVLDAIRELGYVANPVARNLAGGQNRLLGIFTYEAIFPIQNQDFYYPFLVGIEEEATAVGYDLLLYTSTGGPDGRRSIYHDGINRLGLADGAILLGQEREKGELVQLAEEGYPFVFVGRREIPGGALAYVGADYVTATAGVVEHLFALGHRSIAYLGMDITHESAQDREVGYFQAFQQAGFTVDPEWFQRLDRQATTTAIIEEFLCRGVTAFVVEHDSAVQALYQAAGDLKLSIPIDFSVAKLGDALSGAPLSIEMTGFTIPRREMGAEAVRLLTRILDGNDLPTRQVMLPCRFVPGNTVARMKGVRNA